MTMMEVEKNLTNKEAEKSILGILINNRGLFTQARGWIRSTEAFWSNTHKFIWVIMNKLFEQKKPFDPITIIDTMNNGNYEEIDPEYIAHLSTYNQPNLLNSHCKIVWHRYIQRCSIKVANKLGQVSKKAPEKIDELLMEHDVLVKQLKDLRPVRNKTLNEIADSTANNIIHGNNIMPYGLPYMDDIAGGMSRGELTGLGGRPGNNKTMYALYLIKRQIELGKKVMLFNREMTNEQALARLMVMESNILTSNNIRRNIDSKEIQSEVLRVSQIMKDKYQNLLMHDSIKRHDTAILEIEKHQPDVFVEDYVQLTQCGGELKHRDRRFEIEKIMFDYKWCAKESQSHGIILSQMNRGVDSRTDFVPQLSDFAEGSTIEHSIETAIFLIYPYTFNSEDYGPTLFKLVVRKARYGQIGTYTIGYNGNKCKFYSTPQKAAEA